MVVKATIVVSKKWILVLCFSNQVIVITTIPVGAKTRVGEARLQPILTRSVMLHATIVESRDTSRRIAIPS